MRKKWIALVALMALVSVVSTTVAFAGPESQVAFGKKPCHAPKCK